MVTTSYSAVVKTTTRNVSVNTDIMWQHYETQAKQLDTAKQVKEPIHQQRDIAPKKKQASTATISTTISQMSLDSSNPSNSLPKTRKDKTLSKDRSS